MIWTTLRKRGWDDVASTVTYEEFENAEIARANQQQEQFAKARRQAVEEEIRQLKQAVDVENVAKKKQARAEQQETTKTFTGEYAQNGLQHAVTQRQWQQRLSDLGLSDSGLRQTTRRRAAEQKAVADAAVSDEKRQQLEELTQSLSEWLAKQESARQEQAAKLRAAAEKEIAQNETALYKAAKSRATSQYKAALSAAAKGVNAK